MTTQKPSNSSSSASTSAEKSAELAFDTLVTGRLALQTVQSQLDQEADSLRAQLAINRSHRRSAEEMLDKVDAKLTKHYPKGFAVLTCE
jgi:hypothetical protein